jgi:ubiquinone/menaquinone biosynthesis C-methylase UbiE
MDFKVDQAVRLLGCSIVGARVLDVCAGSGMDAELLVRRGAALVNLDISVGALARARERNRRYGVGFLLVAGDAEHLPFKDGTFDYAFVHDGLHHLDAPRNAISEMARVSRSGFLITEPADAWLTWLATRLRIIPEREDSGNEVRRVHPSTLIPFSTELGYKTVRFKRYLVKYPHQPGPLFRLLDRRGIYPVARMAFLLFGAGLLSRLGNKITFVALRQDAD